MKINILLDSPNNTLSGYVNVDPIADPNDIKRVVCDVDNLTPLVDDGEAEVIIVTEVLAYFPFRDLDRLVNHWVSKLKKGGGRLTITDIDFYEVTRDIQSRKLNLEEANMLLYGHEDKPWRYRKALISGQLLADLLRSKGLKIVKHRLGEYKFVVEAVK